MSLFNFLPAGTFAGTGNTPTPTGAAQNQTVSAPNDSFTNGWGNFIGGVRDTVGGLFDIATDYENYRQTRQASGQQQLINTPTTDYNPNVTQNGSQTAPTGQAAGGQSMQINQQTLVNGGLLLVGALVVMKLIKN